MGPTLPGVRQSDPTHPSRRATRPAIVEEFLRDPTHTQVARRPRGGIHRRLGAALFSGTASASTEAASTPVPIVTPDGVVFSYLLNTKIANPGQTKVVSNAVEKAGGVVVQAWPQIGVVVAHSDRAAFRTDVAKAAGNALESVGATRSVPVSEGTPADVPTTWGKGASGYKQGREEAGQRRPAVPGPAAAAATPARPSSGTCR